MVVDIYRISWGDVDRDAEHDGHCLDRGGNVCEFLFLPLEQSKMRRSRSRRRPGAVPDLSAVFRDDGCWLAGISRCAWRRIPLGVTADSGTKEAWDASSQCKVRAQQEPTSLLKC